MNTPSHNNRRCLSSSLTLAIKLSVPLIAGTISIVIALLIGDLFLSLIVISIALFVSWYSWQLKRICVDDKFFYISNFASEVAIPFAGIERATWFGNWTVLIYLRKRSKFGRTILFLPQDPIRKPSNRFSVIDEINLLTEKNKLHS